MQSRPSFYDPSMGEIPLVGGSFFETSHIAPHEVLSSLEYNSQTSSQPTTHENLSPSNNFNDQYYDGHPILMRIHCFGVDVVVDINVPTNGEIQWGYVAFRALKRWRELLPPKLTEEHRLFLQNYIPAEGPYDILIYEPRNRIIHRPHESLPLHFGQWTITDPPISYRLVVEGPLLHRFSNEQLQNIFGEYLIANPKDILPLIMTCKRFKQAFSQHSVWSKIQWGQMCSLFRWQGLGGHGIHSRIAENSSMPLVTEERLWRNFAHDHNLNAMETNKLRFSSYRTSRLKFFYGTLSSPTLSAAHSIPTTANYSPFSSPKKSFKSITDSFSSINSLTATKHNQSTNKLSLFQQNNNSCHSQMILWEDAIVRDQILKWAFQRLTSPLSFFAKMASNYFPTSIVSPTQIFPEHILPVWTLSHYEQAPSIRSYMKKFFQQLHFIVPTTATRYHLQLYHKFPSNPKTNKGGTLFPHGQLLNIEASPENSRSRSLPADPGTRVEMTAEGDQYRRIGDLRLTFLQCEAASYFLSANEANMLAWMRSSMRDLLLDKTLGTVLWLSLPPFEYSTNSWKMSNSALFSIILMDLGHSIRRLRESMTTAHWLPLIIFVGLSFEDSILKYEDTNTATSSERAIDNQGNEIAEVVAEIADQVKEAFTSTINANNSNNFSDCATSGNKKTVLSVGRVRNYESDTFSDEKINLPCQWYIQPYNQDAKEENLQEGILPGWNWLWRTLAKQRDQSSNNSR